MKKILSILLVLLIIFNTGGYFFIYFQLENHFKKIAFNKINKYIPLEKLEKIELKENSISSGIKDNIDFIGEKEIRYNGNMYDIYMIIKRDSKVILYCISDENEDIIHSAFDVYINEKGEDNEINNLTNIIKIFISLGLVPNQTNHIRNNTSKNIYSYYNIIIQKVNLEIPSPPPKLIS